MDGGISFPDFITSDYVIGDFLGSGAFGCVHRVKERYTGIWYALKAIEKKGCSTNESHIMLQLNHPNITSLHEHFETRKKCYIIMDYMRGGSLRKRLEKTGKLSENLSKLYFYQMCQAVEYLHDNDITHRDLKPDNILLASNHYKTLLKISDFGCSINCYNYMYSQVGTKIYVAPEVINGYKYTNKVDIWSLGIILSECLSGLFPFKTYNDIMNGNYNFNYSQWDSVSDGVKSLLKSIFKVQPRRRCNITYVLKYYWLQDDDVEDFVQYLQQQYA